MFGAHNDVKIGGIVGVMVSPGVGVGVGVTVGVGVSDEVGAGDSVDVAVGVVGGDGLGLADELPGAAEQAASRKTVPAQAVTNRVELSMCVITLLELGARWRGYETVRDMAGTGASLSSGP